MKKYSKETKLAAVRSYLEGIESLRTTSEKYCVSKSALHRWIAASRVQGTIQLNGKCLSFWDQTPTQL